MKQVILFDLDGTLTESRQPVEPEMAALFSRLTEQHKVGVVTGCSITQLNRQLLARLPSSANLRNVYLFPSTSSCCYTFADKWQCIYEEIFSDDERARITAALLSVCSDMIDKPYGDVIEDRGGQISVALLGLDAPLHLKSQFDPDGRKRLRLKRKLDTVLPDCNIIVGGTTTISATRKGTDKARCLSVLADRGIDKADILFIGDALHNGGNDSPILSAGVTCVGVSSPNDTVELLHDILEAEGGRK